MPGCRAQRVAPPPASWHPPSSQPPFTPTPSNCVHFPYLPPLFPFKCLFCTNRCGVPPKKTLQGSTEGSVAGARPQSGHSAAAEGAHSVACAHAYLDGFHKGGRLAHGVYEGSYRDILTDCAEMATMLERQARGPQLLQKPELKYPDPPEMPK